MLNKIPATRPLVTIVSGLPRSGTSMMMRILESGGMPVLIDGKRASNDDNPAGYYEYEPVKQTKRDPSWLAVANGKAVKMVYRLLYDLPKTCDYRVLFMRRNLEEVLASQRVMLQRTGRPSDTDDWQMSELFRLELQQFDAWVVEQPCMALINVDYARLIHEPARAVEQIACFLSQNLDQAAMCAVVDPSLYRQRRG